MNYFGEPYPSALIRAPVYETATRVPTPVGEECWYCDRKIEEGDRGFVLDGPEIMGTTITHRRCLLLSVLGEDLYESLGEEIDRASGNPDSSEWRKT